MRRKIKGWHRNFLGEKKRKILAILSTLYNLEKNRENRDFTNEKV
jgi:hypothetical protein